MLIVHRVNAECTHGYININIFKNIDTLVHWYIGTLVHWYITNVPICNHVGRDMYP
jgi:hypothetical protein